MTDHSIYTPLPKKSHSIRLLYLLCGRWQDEIYCTLGDWTIADAQNRYVTISYTWGNIETTRQRFITCNARQIPISDNLYTILRRLRRPDTFVLVWADALCINQSDATERTHQVGLMGEIYKNSYETIIWLGEQQQDDDIGERFADSCMRQEDRRLAKLGGPPKIAWQGDWRDRRLRTHYMWDYEPSDPIFGHDSYFLNPEVKKPRNDIFGAFCLVQSLAHGTSSLAIDFLGVDITKPSMYAREECKIIDQHGEHRNLVVQNARSERVRAGLQRLMSKPWWTRIWVIQETVLAQKATVRYGLLSAPWTMFANAAAQFQRDHHRLCLDLAGTLPDTELLSRFSNTVLQIDSTRRRYKDESHTTLLSLLWKYRSLEASDKRDKVYALIGLTTNWQGISPLAPNYNLDVGSTFLQTSLSTISRSASLSILAGDFSATLGRKRLKGIPSWVMDWALPCLQLEVDRVNSLSMYNTSGGLKGPIHFHRLHTILEVQGAYIDDVISVGEVSRHTQITDTLHVIRSWKLLADQMAERFSCYPNGATYQTAFWRTLIGDIVHTGHLTDSDTDVPYRRATKADFEAYDAWRMWARCISRDTIGRTATFTQRDLDEGISAIHYALKTVTASRCFYVTRNGYMGIGPKSTLPGDRLYALKGSNVPFLVRPDSLRDCAGMGWNALVQPDLNQPAMGTCEEPHSCHRLVGDCFAYGLMDGEVFTNLGIRTRRLFLV
ncbi:hypothetical protein K491DRAFT_607655 [Lophiostoma macrostomum CBS 122681]|uniref:Heterokaryon incompatibility domain-containing protein n=1 Tax=Lophiostoma macrostomum CBS 122681 TaxID=1314788 RepID=A0A6A6SX59_9PLEO|nr:hypothetical protein K491DRAFT_607655 [Lophiostoma macrostomum CBS 122681]